MSIFGANNQQFSLKSPPPSIQLKKILANYPEGTQIFKEGLQNADDSNASLFSVILDTRKHNVKEPALERFAGPSILMYNDNVFSDRDWLSIQNMFLSEKAENAAVIGKYGMGSRSYFHVADIVQIVSNEFYAYMDPDHVLNTNGGDKIKFAEKPLDYEDHLNPFKNIFGFDVTKRFRGTIFRLPLRLGRYARESKFAPYEYTVEKGFTMMSTFVRELEECLLFLNHVRKIELLVHEQFDDKPYHYASVEKKFLDVSFYQGSLIDEVDLPRYPDIAWNDEHKCTVNEYLQTFGNIDALVDTISGKTFRPRYRTITRMTEVDDAQRRTYSYWSVGKDVVLNDKTAYLIHAARQAPVVGIAIPLLRVGDSSTAQLAQPPEKSSHILSDARDTSIELNVPSESYELCWNSTAQIGKLFTYLPISDAFDLGLPFHIHGNFCLSDNRRDLWLSSNADMHGQAKTWSEWNKVLFEYSADTLIDMLNSLKNCHTMLSLFPNEKLTHKNIRPFVDRVCNLLPTLEFSLDRNNQCINRIRFGDTKLILLSRKVWVALSTLFTNVNFLKSSGIDVKVSMYNMITEFGNHMTKITKSPHVVIPERAYLSLSKSEASTRSVSFLTAMFNTIIPYWTKCVGISALYQSEKYFLHWMFVVVHVLGEGSQEEIKLFKPVVNELRFLPVSSSNLATSLGVLSDEVGCEIDFLECSQKLHIDTVPFTQPILNDANKIQRYSLRSPKEIYDVTLTSFRIAADYVPTGIFCSATCLRVLRSWGLRQTLTWGEMSKEIAIRICNTETMTVSI